MTLELLLGGALAGFLAVVVAFFKGRSSGREQERAAQARDQIAALRLRKEIDDETDRLGPADLDRELERWMRDKPPR